MILTHLMLMEMKELLLPPLLLLHPAPFHIALLAVLGLKKRDPRNWLAPPVRRETRETHRAAMKMAMQLLLTIVMILAIQLLLTIVMIVALQLQQYRLCAGHNGESTERSV